MDYAKHYGLLIERARSRTLDCYSESHHVIPRCLGGSDSTDNIVDLTPEEHFVAHQLLVKMHPGNGKLIFAAQMMTRHTTSHRVNNKMFGWLKRKTAKAFSEMLKGVPKTEEHKKAMRGKRPHVNQSGGRNNNARPIMSPYGRFETMSDCAKHIGRGVSYVSYQLDQKKKDWRRVEA